MISAQSRQMSAHRMIKRWSMGNSTQLVRAGTARDVTAAIMDWSWQERQTVAADNAVKIRLSMIPVDPTPDEMLDYVVMIPKGGTPQYFKINKKPSGPRPGDIAIFWDLECLAISADSIS